MEEGFLFFVLVVIFYVGSFYGVVVVVVGNVGWDYVCVGECDCGSVGGGCSDE